MSITDTVNKSEDVMAAGGNVKIPTDTAPKKINYNIDELFINAHEIEKKKGIRIILWGGAGTGKTKAAMSFPDPIYYLDTDGGLTPNLKYYPNKDIRVLECYETISDEGDVAGFDDQPFDVDPIRSLQKIDYATKALASDPNAQKANTIVVDTISDIWSWMGTWLDRKTTKQISSKGTEFMNRFAWGDANNRYDWLMKRLKKLNANIVLIARSKPVYMGGEITANIQLDGQKRSDYYVDFVVQMQKRVGEGKPPTWLGILEKSRGLNGDPIIENFNYEKLKKLIDEDHSGVEA